MKKIEQWTKEEGFGQCWCEGGHVPDQCPAEVGALAAAEARKGEEPSC